jgi:ABC-type lipoprotein release transport system permease subunit
MLYQVEPWDPTTFIAGTAVLFAIALVASFIPARSAARIHPTEAIKAE